MLRGRVIAQDGRLLGDLGYGKPVAGRKIDGAVLGKPAL
jgi:hypothetical protein